MRDFDPDALKLEETDARYLGETECVRFDGRIGARQVAVDVSVEALEELIGEALLSSARLLDAAEANRIRLARMAGEKACGATPTGGVILLSARDVPRRGVTGSGDR